MERIRATCHRNPVLKMNIDPGSSSGIPMKHLIGHLTMFRAFLLRMGRSVGPLDHTVSQSSSIAIFIGSANVHPLDIPRVC
ncbi:hypothetical protein V8B97DRAFT_817834 [Scleroderma yunnanense]